MELSKRKISVYSSLGSKKHRQKHNLFMVEGEKSIADTLGHFLLEALIVKKGFTPSLFSLKNCDPDSIFEAGDQEMKKISSLSTAPEVLAVYALPAPVFEDYGNLDRELYLMLDGVQDPGNLGTIVRTAHWFGIKQIFASKDTVDIFNPKAIQASMGSFPFVGVDYCDLKEVISSNPDLPVCGLLLDGRNIYEARLPEYGFIVMGNEGNGISKELRSSVTEPLLIPPFDAQDHGESLNVAIATAVTLSEFRKKALSTR